VRIIRVVQEEPKKGNYWLVNFQDLTKDLKIGCCQFDDGECWSAVGTGGDNGDSGYSYSMDGNFLYSMDFS